MNVKKALGFFAKPKVQTLDEQLANIKIKAEANFKKMQEQPMQDGFQKAVRCDDVQDFKIDKLELKNKTAADFSANDTNFLADGYKVEEFDLKDLSESEMKKFKELWSSAKDKEGQDKLNDYLSKTSLKKGTKEVLKGLKSTMPPVTNWELVPKD
jgi:hypothetical protein